MLFKVIYTPRTGLIGVAEDIKSNVYAIRKPESISYKTFFLLYFNNGWHWVDANDCKPLIDED